jgi:hypothetical protein
MSTSGANKEEKQNASALESISGSDNPIYSIHRDDEI